MKIFTLSIVFMLGMTIMGQDNKVIKGNSLNDKFQLRERKLKEKVNHYAEIFEIFDLKDKEISQNTLEIRIWSGFGLQELDCFTLRIENGENNVAYYFNSSKNNPSKFDKLELEVSNTDLSKYLEYLSNEGISREIKLFHDKEYISDPDQHYIFIEVKSTFGYQFVWQPTNSEVEDGKKVIKVCTETNKRFKVSLTCK